MNCIELSRAKRKFIRFRVFQTAFRSRCCGKSARWIKTSNLTPLEPHLLPFSDPDFQCINFKAKSKNNNLCGGENLEGKEYILRKQKRDWQLFFKYLCLNIKTICWYRLCLIFTRPSAIEFNDERKFHQLRYEGFAATTHLKNRKNFDQHHRQRKLNFQVFRSRHATSYWKKAYNNSSEHFMERTYWKRQQTSTWEIFISHGEKKKKILFWNWNFKLDLPGRKKEQRKLYVPSFWLVL